MGINASRDYYFYKIKEGTIITTDDNSDGDKINIQTDRTNAN